MLVRGCYDLSVLAMCMPQAIPAICDLAKYLRKILRSQHRSSDVQLLYNVAPLRKAHIHNCCGHCVGARSGTHQCQPQLARNHHTTKRGKAGILTGCTAAQVSGLGRVNTNPKSREIFGEWNIVYASGRSGLTALDGKISKFRVGDDGSYENECATATLGVIPGARAAAALTPDTAHSCEFTHVLTHTGQS